MVTEQYQEFFVCPFCKNQYGTEDIAIDCVRECITDFFWDEPERREIYTYACECCSEKFGKEVEAENCEKKHKKNNDLKFQEYERRISMEKLIKAGNHATQMRLKNYL